MIKKLDIAGVHTEITPELRKYVEKKIGKLDRYIAKHAREAAHAEVKLRETKSKDKNRFNCTVVIFNQDGDVEASESTINMFAAIDIVETKLKTQLKKKKELHGDAKMRRTMFSRFRRKDPTLGQG